MYLTIFLFCVSDIYVCAAKMLTNLYEYGLTMPHLTTSL
uniref:Uncharacterized protein n=1 Tax=Setaria italica TaxID=4555 RepID=K3XTK4_SETIT